VQTDDRLRDLSGEIAAVMRRFQIQTTGNLAQQVQRRTRRPVQVDHLKEARVQSGKPVPGGRGFTGTDLAGQQPRASVVDQKLQSRLNLLPSDVLE